MNCSEMVGDGDDDDDDDGRMKKPSCLLILPWLQPAARPACLNRDQVELYDFVNISYVDWLHLMYRQAVPKLVQRRSSEGEYQFGSEA